MRVELVYFTGCPNVAPLRERLRRCLARLGIADEIVEIDTGAPAVPDRYRNLGSPTVLIDGVDVLASPGGGGASCRLQLPDEAQLLAALGGRPKG